MGMLNESDLHEMHTWDEILRLIVPDVNSRYLGPMEKAMVKRYFDLRRRNDGIPGDYKHHVNPF